MTDVKQVKRVLAPVCLLAAFPLLLLYAPQIFDGIHGALLLCVSTLIPALFPFSVLSDLLAPHLGALKMPAALDAICRKLFGVSANGMTAFLIGALCGFPLGVKYAADLCRAGAVTKEEAEQLLAFCNNTGPAFLVAGVGYRMFQNRMLGLLLYLLQLVTALCSGMLLQKICPVSPACKASNRVAPVSTGLSAAVKRNAGNMLAVCGMVVFFSIPLSILRLFVKNDGLLLFISSFLEVGGASALAATAAKGLPTFALICLTNAVCFGGLSVHMQAALFLSDLPISRKRHTAGKLLQSAIACLLLFILIYVQKL